MTVVDQTATDGARTKDKIDFSCKFKGPNGDTYRVTCEKPLPHGMAYPFFGGVVTNHLLHGVTGIGTRLMPTEYTYAAFWGVGTIYRNGKAINKNHLVHVMVTEIVRGENYKLQFDGDVGEPPQGKTLHLMVPPFKPVKGDGLKKSPVLTGYKPFPDVKKHMKKTMKRVKGMPDGPKKKRKLATLKQVKKMMHRTKKHVMKAMKAGKMKGQPFLHVMFGNIQMSGSH